MADARLTLDDLTEVTTLQTTDVVLIKRPGGSTLKVEVGDLLSLVKPADSIHGATAKTSLADLDEIGLADSASSFSFKKFTLSSMISSIFKTARTIANAQFASASFKLFNAATTPRSLTFNTTALTADRVFTIPDRNVDLDNLGLGSGQSWQTPTRTVGSVYQNTTGRTITVHVSASRSGTADALFQVSPDNSVWTSVASARVSSSDGNVSVIHSSVEIPSGNYYRLTGTSLVIGTWAELRV